MCVCVCVCVCVGFDPPRPTLLQRIKSDPSNAERIGRLAEDANLNISAMGYSAVFREDISHANHSEVDNSHHLGLKLVA